MTTTTTMWRRMLVDNTTKSPRYRTFTVTGNRTTSTTAAAAAADASGGGGSTTNLDRRRRWWWRRRTVAALGSGMVLVVTVGLTYCFYVQVGGSGEGLRRTLYFYGFAVPKYVEYRYHTWKRSSQDAWDELDHHTATTALRYVTELQGFYIKVSEVGWSVCL